MTIPLPTKGTGRSRVDTLANGKRLLTLTELARRYRMNKATASKWVDSGKAPGKRIANTRRFEIYEEDCDAYDRREDGFWNDQPTVIHQRIVETPFLRRVS